MGQKEKARECLVEFKRRPLTGETIDMLPKINEELNNLNKELEKK